MLVLVIEIEGDAWNLHMVFATEDTKGGTLNATSLVHLRWAQRGV